MTVTKAQLAQLRRERAVPNQHIEYTIDGPVQARVVSSLEAERERRITLGERSLHTALNQLRQDYAHIRHRGYAKSAFEKRTQVIKP